MTSQEITVNIIPLPNRKGKTRHEGQSRYAHRIPESDYYIDWDHPSDEPEIGLIHDDVMKAFGTGENCNGANAWRNEREPERPVVLTAEEGFVATCSGCGKFMLLEGLIRRLQDHWDEHNFDGLVTTE